MRSLLRIMQARILRENPECSPDLSASQLQQRSSDLLVLRAEEAADPLAVFSRLRWGGLLVLASPDPQAIRNLAARYVQSGFRIEEGPAFLRRRLAGLPLPFLPPLLHYCVARRSRLLPPGQINDRFTYHVELLRYPGSGGPVVVLKQVPSLASTVSRLRAKFPQLPEHVIERRARKFTERIFPLFLTRETSMLQLLEQRLPQPYSRRIPRVIDCEKDDRGMVRRLRMNWLRSARRPLTHLAFARQSADLLRILHDVGHVIHLDLRLDNFVITDDGVGFVDFGSAVRDDENVHHNPLLGALFEELMRTSQIQRTLGQMMLSGHVTSQIIRRSQQRIDKAIDVFYLAVQFNNPHANPDLVDLIQYDPASSQAAALSRLTAEILRPADPACPAFRCAADIVRGIDRICSELGCPAG